MVASSGRGMAFDDIEQAVRDGLATSVGTAYDLRRTEDAGYLYLELRPRGTGAAPRSARIWTNGVEAFFVDLDNGFGYREFEWEAGAQPHAVRRLAHLAGRYLDGAGSARQVAGRFGRTRTYFEMELDGEIIRFSEEPGSTG